MMSRKANRNENPAHRDLMPISLGSSVRRRFRRLLKDGDRNYVREWIIWKVTRWSAPIMTLPIRFAVW